MQEAIAATQEGFSSEKDTVGCIKKNLQPCCHGLIADKIWGKENVPFIALSSSNF